MSNAINCDSLMYWIPGFNFQKQFTTTCGYTMNYFVRLTINQLCNSRISESYVCFIFLKHSVKEMTIKCVMIGINIIIAEKFSLEVKCFFYFIPDLFTVQKVVICDPTIHTHKSITFLPRPTIFIISKQRMDRLNTVAIIEYLSL